jgi:hypothetical protein
MIEVEGLVDSLNQHQIDEYSTFVATKLSEPAFAKVWNNPDDVEYDNL